jgi:hypothetical protein
MTMKCACRVGACSVVCGWPQQQRPKHVVDVAKLYTPDDIVVLRLLYPYGIITLGSAIYIFLEML